MFISKVRYNDGDQYPWKVLGLNPSASQPFMDSKHRLKQQAEKTARQLAKENRPSQLVVERRDGQVTYTQRYET